MMPGENPAPSLPPSAEAACLDAAFFPLHLNDLCDTQLEGLLVLAPLFSPQTRIEFVLEFIGGWQERAYRRSNHSGGAMCRVLVVSRIQ